MLLPKDKVRIICPGSFNGKIGYITEFTGKTDIPYSERKLSTYLVLFDGLELSFAETELERA